MFSLLNEYETRCPYLRFCLPVYLLSVFPSIIRSRASIFLQSFGTASIFSAQQIFHVTSSIAQYWWSQFTHSMMIGRCWLTGIILTYLLIYELTNLLTGCLTACECNETGSLLSSDGRALSCDNSTGQCQCRRHVTGLQCERCTDGYWSIRSDNPDGCQRTFTPMIRGSSQWRGGVGT